MINKIKSFFEKNIAVDKPENADHQLKLATAALLVEMMQQDEHVKEEEIRAVKESLMSKFNLSAAESHDLFELAQLEAEQATDYYQFTSLIAKGYSAEQKFKVIELLWTVAYADNHLDQYEDYMIRRICDLIYVRHNDMIRLKLKVLGDS